MATIEMADDLFWLKFAKDHITDAVSSRDEAAKTLDTYLKFVWAIYTGFFAISTAFSIIPGSVITKLVMGLPVLIIPIAGFYCVKTQLPVFESFHPDEPDSIIRDLYAKIISQKNKDLTTAKLLALISALSIGVAVFIFRLGDMATNYTVTVSVQTYSKTLRIQAVLPKDQPFSLLATGYDSTGKTAHLIEISKIITNDKGLVDTLINNNEIVKDPVVFCSWKADNKTQQVISSK
jgi:hypothetical protein